MGERFQIIRDCYISPVLRKKYLFIVGSATVTCLNKKNPGY